jgi:hypothetical protein
MTRRNRHLHLFDDRPTIGDLAKGRHCRETASDPSVVGRWVRMDDESQPGSPTGKSRPQRRLVWALLKAEREGFEPSVRFDPYTAFPVVNS